MNWFTLILGLVFIAFADWLALRFWFPLWSIVITGIVIAGLLLIIGSIPLHL